MGLRALSILDGDLVVFYSGAQIGALEAYLHAAAFAVLGASRETISLAPVVVGGLTLAVFFLFVRELLGPLVAVVALLFLAFPAPTYLAWTYMPNSYPETVFFCVATLWLAARINRRGVERWSPFALGLSAGLGWWNSPLTLAASLPAVFWLVLVRREARRIAFGALLIAAFLCGAAPWIVYNLRYRFPSLWQARPVASAASVGEAAARFFAKNLPELTVGMDPLGPGTPLTPLQGILRIPAAAVYFAGAAFLFGAYLLAEKDRHRRESLLLPCLVALAMAGIFIFSAGGQFPGTSVRYVLPLFFVLCVALGLMIQSLGRRSRASAIALAAVVLVFNLSGYYWPWTAQRRLWRENKKRDERALQFLQARDISWICGEYWTVYPFNFLSRRRLKAAPFETQFDFYGVGRALPRAGRAALVGRERSELEGWASRSGLTGPIFSVGPGYAMLLPQPPPQSSSSDRLYARLLVSAGRR
jgi:4-amino-4-deoxy-L-arabinose transferase-like glycosyltransferase